jgi:hypothetical protein
VSLRYVFFHLPGLSPLPGLTASPRLDEGKGAMGMVEKGFLSTPLGQCLRVALIVCADDELAVHQDQETSDQPCLVLHHVDELAVVRGLSSDVKLAEGGTV